MKTMTYKNESGFTLLELLLVIGVAALLLIGGIATYRLVSDGNKATEASRLLLTLRQESQTLAQQQGGTYTGIAFDSTAAEGAANGGASPLVVGGILRTGQRNPFNGDIIIEPNAASAQNLDISFENVSQASCVKLVQAINNANEIVSVNANGGTAFTSANDDFPISATDAAGLCTTSSNTITWVFP